jgi:Sec7 domain
MADDPIDQAYILAFSLIMLHTDAFNKSNKHKMTKTAYVKNTRLPGVQPEVLDVCTDDQLSKLQLITANIVLF